MIKRFQFVLLLLVFFTIESYSYIDPGTGSYIVQIIIAAFVGASLAVKMFWGKIKGFFASLFGGKKKDEINEEAGSTEQ